MSVHAPALEETPKQVDLGLEQDVLSFQALCESWEINLREPWPDRFGKSLNEWAKESVHPKIRTISLFSGAGGLDIGFHDAGFDIVEAVEINASYAETLEANSKPNGYFGSGKVRNIDIREYHPTKCGWQRGEIDFIIGGPPCQTFSAGGRRAGGVQGTTEERGTLFEEYVRLLKELQPRAFLFENVYGITGAEAGEAWARIQKAFASAGYKLFHRVLDAADYGVPQHRERMIIVGVLAQANFAFPAPTHGPDSPDGLPFYSAGDAFRNLAAPPATARQNVNGKYCGLLEQIPPGLNYSYFTEKMGHPRPLFAWRSKFSDFLYKADPTRPVKTIKAFCGKYTGPFHWDSRRFTEAELKRLQTFPDNYEIKGTASVVRQQIGNSVPPQLARILALSILDQIFEVRPEIALPTLNANSRLGFRTRKREMNTLYAERAKEAIGGLTPSRVQNGWKKNRRIAFTVTDGFKFVTDGKDAACSAEIKLEDNTLRVLTTPNFSKSRPAFRIRIEPSQKNDWLLPVKKVELAGVCLDKQCYVGAWKVFEKWLSENNFKDDLVQLNGYYAYEPKLSCKLEFAANADLTPVWKSLRQVVEGNSVQKTLTGTELAKALGIRESQLKNILLEIRALGYEIRSAATNPQIPEDSFLIPYAFPTFTHRSVQFHKELF
jgi:DNA (cytosine-5)-methyltransferase 1